MENNINNNTEKKLALFNVKPIFNEELPETNNLGPEEKAAVMRVMDTGVLSAFVAKFDPRFYCGVEVKKFEKTFQDMFKVKHAVSCNSATTALQMAVAAAGIGPGDEVITSPYTMSATPSAVLMNQGIPIFADIDPDTFCIDPADVERKITPRTKAVLSVNIFGHMPDYDRLRQICDKYNLILIEDCAQSPLAHYNGKYTGTVGDIGVFSFNFHKTMHCGEGGVLTTNNDKFALRAQLMRNHGEVVVDFMEENDPRRNEIILGNNFRLSELHAAIATEQLKKINHLTEKRVELAEYLTRKLKAIPGITTPLVRNGSSHVYYLYAMKFDANIWGISRNTFIKALRAEGAPVAQGYVKPLYLIPMYQNKQVYNESHYPFDSKYYDGNPDYSKGSCPVVEEMFEKTLFTTNICRYPLTTVHMDLFISAIQKVWDNKEQLKALDLRNEQKNESMAAITSHFRY